MRRLHCTRPVIATLWPALTWLTGRASRCTSPAAASHGPSPAADKLPVGACMCGGKPCAQIRQHCGVPGADLLLHAAQGEAPAVQARQVAQQGVDPLRLARVGHARHDGELAGHDLRMGASRAAGMCLSRQQTDLRMGATGRRPCSEGEGSAYAVEVVQAAPASGDALAHRVLPVILAPNLVQEVREPAQNSLSVAKSPRQASL